VFRMNRARDLQGLLIPVVAWVLMSLLVAVGAAAGKLAWIALLLPAVLAIGYLLGSRWPVYALAALIACVAVERADIGLLPSGAINMRLDEVLGPAIAAGLLVRAARANTLRTLLRGIPGLLPLGIFLLLNVVVTVISAETLSRGNLSRGINLVIILAAGALCYVAVCLAVLAVRDAREITFPLLLTAGVEAVIGIVAIALSVALGKRLFGVQTDFGTLESEPYGTMYEANFFGHYTAAITALVLAIAVGLALQRRWRWRNGLWLMALAGFTFTAMVLSLTRTAWLALALSIVAMAAVYGAAIWVRRRGAAPLDSGAPVRGTSVPSSVSPPRNRLKLGLTALVVMIAGFGIAFARETSGGSPSVIVNSLSLRLSTPVNVTGGSGYGRVLILKLSLSDWWRSPLFGLGNGSFNLYALGQTTKTGHPWIYSMLLAILHDSGLVGLTLILWFLIAIGRRAWQAIRATDDPTKRWLMIGISGATLVMLIGAQATSSFYLMLLWVFLGLAAAVPAHLAQASERPGPDDLMAPADAASHAWREDPLGIPGRA
jgi:O-antigen ligase